MRTKENAHRFFQPVSLFSPTRRKELVRDFIGDSLYNNSYGYFQKTVHLFDFDEKDNKNHKLDFTKIKNSNEFSKILGELYARNYMSTCKEVPPDNTLNDAKIISSGITHRWHTPSELFRPHYGRHIGRRIWNLYHQLKLHEPLKILEVGPGNGALCSSIIEYFLEQHPKLHLEMQYHLVELSAKNCTKLNAMIATQQLQANVRCHHKSILDFANPTHKEGHWFVLGFELLDNFPHDKIAYDADGQLLQCVIESDDEAFYGCKGFQESFVPVNDAAILNAVQVLDAIGHRSPSVNFSAQDWFLSFFYPREIALNRWKNEYIPTMMISFLEKLFGNFPNHTLILADFDYLPDKTVGHNAPLVQASWKGNSCVLSTYLVKRGVCDIVFETNFGRLKKIYGHFFVKNKLQNNYVCVKKHSEYFKDYFAIKQLNFRDGSNPILDDYSNVCVFEATTRKP